jgi:serine/threonine protein kinase
MKLIEAFSSLRSPHVVYFYGAVIEPKVCIVMEYCSRGSLYDVLKDETISIDWNRLFGIIIEAVKGILCLHSWKPQVCDSL